MNIEPLVTYSGNLMYHTAREHGGKLHLCYWEKKLQCLPVQHTIHRHVILFTFEAQKFLAGLEAAEWDQIRQEISKLTKELELCLHSTKTSTKTRP